MESKKMTLLTLVMRVSAVLVMTVGAISNSIPMVLFGGALYLKD